MAIDFKKSYYVLLCEKVCIIFPLNMHYFTCEFFTELLVSCGNVASPRRTCHGGRVVRILRASAGGSSSHLGPGPRARVQRPPALAPSPRDLTRRQHTPLVLVAPYSRCPLSLEGRRWPCSRRGAPGRGAHVCPIKIAEKVARGAE